MRARHASPHSRVLLHVGVPFVVMLFVSSIVSNQVAADPTPPQLGVLATLDITTLIPADDPAITGAGTNDPTTTGDPPHLSRGGGYRLFGTGKKDSDPEAGSTPYNEVISFDTTDPAAIAGVFRKFGDGVKVDRLDNQVELKYFFSNRTCGGGSPRVQLGISGDGDGNFQQFPGGPDQNAFGYLGDMPFGGGCVSGLWVREDMTNNVPKWDLSQWTPFGAGAFCTAGNAMTCTWTQMETFFNTVFPNHRVLNANLVDDSASFFPAGRGCVYFDLYNTGARTLTGWEDVAEGSPQPNGC